jgi:hypothetical protein
MIKTAAFALLYFLAKKPTFGCDRAFVHAGQLSACSSKPVAALFV